MQSADALRLAGRPHYIGATNLPRIEDDRALTGLTTFVGDMRLPGMLEMVVVRSPIAHGRLANVGLREALLARDVVAAVTASDLLDVSPFPDFFPYAKPVALFPLVRDRIRYAGAPVAAIVAADRYTAEDAAELVQLEWEDLPVVLSIDDALRTNSARLFDDWEDNRMLHLSASDPAVEAALQRHRNVRERYAVHRHTAVPLEGRACLADVQDGRLTLWTNTQFPHIARTTLSYVLPLRESDIRVIAPDVGGAFGCKQHVYPEEVLACFLAIQWGRPIRWIEDRTEHMVATCHARDVVLELEAAVDDSGHIVALRTHLFQDLGSAEIFPAGFCPSLVTGAHMTGPYRISLADVSITGVVTNKTPSGAFRGYGIPEAVFAVERFVEKVADECGVDSVDLRRQMLLRDEDLPYKTPQGAVIDSGSFERAFERSIELGRSAFKRGADRHKGQANMRVGLGFATYREGTAATHFGSSGHWTGYDSASLHVEPDGTLVVSTGTTSQGQGAATLVATVAADAVGVPLDQVRVVMGDTDLCPYGLGAWASRGAVVAAGAILAAAGKLRGKILHVAAHLLEASADDLVIDQGAVHVRGAERPSISLREVATVALVRTLDLPRGLEPGLDSRAVYDPAGLQHVPDESGRINAAAAWANATHAAVVRVDTDTGDVRILDYIVVHDCGPMLNPVIVEGQVIGGVAHGIGGTLYEDLPFGDQGQPLATTFMDYLLPTSTDIPHVTLEHFESPSPSMPLGIKGVGEGGTIGCFAAVANAVANALAGYGVNITSTPLTPSAVQRLIAASRAAGVESRRIRTPESVSGPELAASPNGGGASGQARRGASPKSD
jgi:aerobic carbon-monoxide dehydrogenase large subunit